MSTAQKIKNPHAKSIRLIRVLIKERGLNEAEYRTLYREATSYKDTPGKGSLSDMDGKELSRVIAALKSKQPATGTKHQGVPLCSLPQARKIRSLWLTLRDKGVLRDSSEAALLQYVNTHTGIARMEWLKPQQMHSIIESLKQWIARIEREQAQKQAEDSAATAASSI